MISVIQGSVAVHLFGRFPRKEKNNVRISQDADAFVTVKVVESKRDVKTDKMAYSTVESLKVFDATPEQVARVVIDALKQASNRKP